MTRQLVTQAQRLQHLLADLLDVDRLRHGLVRASANGAANVAGTGIGLALVAQFAALQGGRAWVEDRPGGGASFRVSLPLGTD